ncbi:MAG: hypothetical protein FJ015_07525 [Chloroflexi bacterium]|nr:hypothetical protein [Chloroflexota bacterium]
MKRPTVTIEDVQAGMTPEFECPPAVDEHSTKDELARWITWQRWFSHGSRNPRQFYHQLLGESKTELLLRLRMWQEAIARAKS